VPKKLNEHYLKVDPKATPKKQQLRQFPTGKREAIKKELAKLLAASFIKAPFGIAYFGFSFSYFMQIEIL
jgi:hypothetical protein